MSKSSKAAFTVMSMAALVYILFWFAVVIGSIWVLVHFITKFW